MKYLYPFYTEIEEVPFCVVDGNIAYTNEEHIYGIEVEMDIDDNIDFTAGVIGHGYDTKGITDYKSLLAFITKHYDEIEDNDNSFPTRRDCIDELIAVCNKKYRKI